MTHLDYLRKAAKIHQAIWLSFIGEYKDKSLNLYLFVEGKDDVSYYLPLAKRLWQNRGNVSAFDCNGKDNVLALIPRVRTKLDQAWRGLFFIDKDLDDFCGVDRPTDEYVYQTSTYSIENYLVIEETLLVVWTEFFKLPITDARFTRILRDFSQAVEVFNITMKSVMACVLIHRKKGFRVILNDVDMGQILSLDVDCRCSLISGWQDHLIAASNTTTVACSESEITSEMVLFEDRGAGEYIRGKFALWFLVKFLVNVVIPAARTPDVERQSKAVLRFSISDKNILDLVAPRVSYHQSLTSFFENVLPAY